MVRRFVVIGAGIVIVAGAITWYIVGFLTVSPPAFTVPSTPGAVPTAEMTLQTVGSLGSGWSQPGWVSYLIKGTDGKRVHTTIYKLPAHALVHVTIYKFDGASGLRNPSSPGRRASSATRSSRRQARRRDQPEPHLAHVRRPGASSDRADARVADNAQEPCS